MSCLFGVIADDFTGACDVGAQFRKSGLKTVVLTSLENATALCHDFNVLVIDTETRNIAPDAAYCRVGQIATALREINASIIYKKIDSTLRGNLGAEIDAVMDEMSFEAAIITPSFPAHNRTVLEGTLLVRGAPLERTEFAQDTLNPIKESNIAKLLGQQTKRRIGSVTIPKVRSGTESLKKELRRLLSSKNKIIVVDAENQDDLATIAEASADLNILISGSAGLAAEISRMLRLRLKSSSVLVVSGSINSATLNQIKTAEKELKTKVLHPNLSGILTSKEKWDKEVDELVKEANAAFAKRQDVIIGLADSRGSIVAAKNRSGESDLNRSEVVKELLSILGESLRRIIASNNLKGLILVGGDTSVQIIKAVDTIGVQIDREVFPGIPAGRILGGKLDGLPVITKAGGFGDDYTLVNLIKSLRGAE